VLVGSIVSEGAAAAKGEVGDEGTLTRRDQAREAQSKALTQSPCMHARPQSLPISKGQRISAREGCSIFLACQGSTGEHVDDAAARLQSHGPRPARAGNSGGVDMDDGIVCDNAAFSLRWPALPGRHERHRRLRRSKIDAEASVVCGGN
jgi:hypothetical protein